MIDFLLPSPIQTINYMGFQIHIKRDDLIHDEVSGNKLRKMLGNVYQMHNLDFDKVITFGGAHSNHIYALAAYGFYFKLQTVGIIRGDELNENATPTLKFAAKMGMKLIFWSRSDYKLKDTVPKLIEIKQAFPHHFILPEGGTNTFSVEGSAEILDEILDDFPLKPNYICTAVGTGGTLLGLVANTRYRKKIIGFSALKNPIQLKEYIQKRYLKNDLDARLELTDEFCFGGYAKMTTELKDFIYFFESKYHILLDDVYVSKMMFGIFKKIERGDFKPKDVIFAIHTGGLQGKKL